MGQMNESQFASEENTARGSGNGGGLMKNTSRTMYRSSHRFSMDFKSSNRFNSTFTSSL